MGTVGTSLTMSLDGFIAGPGDDVSRIFTWYDTGDTEYQAPSGGMTFKISPQSAEMLREVFSAIGALVMGRRTFDLTNGWGGRHPLDVPIVVVTHAVPEGWAHDGAPFTFVTDGVASAVAQAKAIAGDKNVGVGAASIVQQCIEEGLLEEIQIDLVPVLLGDGVRLFEHLGTEPVDLELTSLIEAPGVTHLRYRVVK